jgi:hypothetical protein
MAVRHSLTVRIGGAPMTKNDVFAQRMVGFALDRGWKPRRLDDLHNRLMTASVEVSAALGLPDGWVDLRKAIDETDGRP